MVFEDCFYSFYYYLQIIYLTVTAVNKQIVSLDMISQ